MVKIRMYKKMLFKIKDRIIIPQRKDGGNFFKVCSKNKENR